MLSFCLKSRKNTESKNQKDCIEKTVCAVCNSKRKWDLSETMKLVGYKVT